MVYIDEYKQHNKYHLVLEVLVNLCKMFFLLQCRASLRGYHVKNEVKNEIK